MKTLELKIDGMTCHHCAMAVRKELSKIPNITVNDLKIGSAVIELDESKTTHDRLKDAVKEAGYSVIAIQ